jgi:hypothetical protein
VDSTGTITTFGEVVTGRNRACGGGTCDSYQIVSGVEVTSLVIAPNRKSATLTFTGLYGDSLPSQSPAIGTSSITLIEASTFRATTTATIEVDNLITLYADRVFTGSITIERFRGKDR